MKMDAEFTLLLERVLVQADADKKKHAEIALLQGKITWLEQQARRKDRELRQPEAIQAIQALIKGRLSRKQCKAVKATGAKIVLLQHEITLLYTVDKQLRETEDLVLQKWQICEHQGHPSGLVSNSLISEKIKVNRHISTNKIRYLRLRVLLKDAELEWQEQGQVSQRDADKTRLLNERLQLVCDLHAHQIYHDDHILKQLRWRQPKKIRKHQSN